MPTLDLKRLGTLLGIIMTSDFDGEVVSARDRLRETLKKAGTDHRVIIEAVQGGDAAAQRDALFEAAKELKIERDYLQGEVERLQRLARPVMQQRATVAARQVNQPISPQQAARRLLCMTDIGLTDFEEDFLGTIAGWTGAITDKQRVVMDKILDKYDDDLF
jgi:hypothetical protein